MERHDLNVLLKGLSRMKLTSPPGAPSGNGAFASTPFTKLGTFGHGGVFVGRFTGHTPWERHRRGDELVQVLAGEVDVTVLTAGKPVHLTLRAGNFCVIERGLWHKQHARAEVTVLTATPQPTDLSFAADPRASVAHAVRRRHRSSR